jgi:hypothetical protein
MTAQKSKEQDLLVSVAESIGSTLGAIAAKADAAAGAAKEAVLGRQGTTAPAKRAIKKAVRRTRRAASGTKKKAARASRRAVGRAKRSIGRRRSRAKK